jgi:uncharacterized membrane protein YqhA
MNLLLIINLFQKIKKLIIFKYNEIEKTMTASLANFLGSLFAGTILVIVPITIALIVVSRLDPLSRENSGEK